MPTEVEPSKMGKKRNRSINSGKDDELLINDNVV